MTAAEPEAARLKLLSTGYCPLPLIGKEPVHKEWQKRHGPTRAEIARWSRTAPAALNTGILTRLTPALDVDILDPDAAEAVERLARERFEELGFFLVRFGRWPKRALLFRTDAPFPKITVSFANGERLEFMCDGQQIVAFGDHPETQRPYTWHGGEPGEIKREDLPYIHEHEARELVEAAVRLLVGQFGYHVTSASKPRPNGGDDGPHQADWGFTPDDLIDHDRLAALAMRLVKSGMDPGAVVNFLRAQVEALTEVDEERRKRRLKEIPAMVDSAEAKLEAERNPQPEVEPTPLDEVLGIFNDCFALKDDSAVCVTLGAIAANLLKGRDPVWLGLVAPPSSAKTELLNSLSRLPFVHDVDTFGPAGLLSGTPRKEKAKDAHGGVLRKLGDFGVLLFKDFGSLLELRHEQRSDMMAGLRRIYDGQYTRQIGAEGGRTLEWRGKAGALFAATQAYDGFHAVVGTLGDRFLLFRVETVAEEQLTKSRLAPGEATDVRQRVAAAVAGLFVALPDPPPEPERMTDHEYAALSVAIRKIVKLRAGIVRDRMHREIDEVHDPEGPARLSIALQQLFAGLVLIGVNRETALELVIRVAYDSAPQLRLKAFKALTDSPQTTRISPTRSTCRPSQRAASSRISRPRDSRSGMKAATLGTKRRAALTAGGGRNDAFPQLPSTIPVPATYPS